MDIMLKIVNAVLVAMSMIRSAQLKPQKHGTAAVKEGDLTVVTPTDKSVEEFLHEELRGLPSVRFTGEEGTTSGAGDRELMVDPLDGTRSFAIRLATSTVIATIVHPQRGVELVVVGDPATGRIWVAEQGQQTTVSAPGIYNNLPCHVWNGELGGKKQAVVFTDHSLGFTRSGRQILTDAQVARLLGLIPSQATLLMPGSNGMNFALVANGSEFMAGQITTAVGGPWDIAPVLLVLQAGGAACGFSMSDGTLKEENPLDIKACDIVVSGNSQATVGRLVRILNEAITGC